MLSEKGKKILEKIEFFETNKLWDDEVEDNPETITLLPNKIDYLGEKCFNRLMTKLANKKAISYFEKEIKKGNFIIKDIVGIENYLSVKNGAIITCNHFSIYDHYAIFRAIRPYFKKNQQLYKVIREGNYTSFKGIFGYFFRHCSTLPLSSNKETMIKFLKSVATLLSRGEKILIYPEQAMWRNYKKPRPMKDGAFKIACKNNVPIIPCFITTDDTDKFDVDGLPIQSYTLWFLPPIHPDKNLSIKEDAERIKNENYNLWKEIYEKVYKKPLVYLGDE